MDTSFWLYALLAFWGGIASFLSPCVLPLVPGYLSFVSGISSERLAHEEGPSRKEAQAAVLRATLLFVLGFGLVFVALGSTASQIGQALSAFRRELSVIAGLFLILFGVQVAGLLRLSFFQRHLGAGFLSLARSPGAAFPIGLAFGLGWTPCIGLILAPILALAARDGSLLRGALLLAIYAAGLGIPFIVAGLFTERFLTLRKKSSPYLPYISIITGVVMALTGFAIIFDRLILVNNWLLRAFPWIGTLG